MKTNSCVQRPRERTSPWRAAVGIANHLEEKNPLTERFFPSPLREVLSGTLRGMVFIGLADLVILDSVGRI